MRNWIDELYVEIKARWNKIRGLPDADTDECVFLVHLMEEIEKNTDDSKELIEWRYTGRKNSMISL